LKGAWSDGRGEGGTRATFLPCGDIGEKKGQEEGEGYRKKFRKKRECVDTLLANAGRGKKEEKKRKGKKPGVR